MVQDVFCQQYPESDWDGMMYFPSTNEGFLDVENPQNHCADMWFNIPTKLLWGWWGTIVIYLDETDVYKLFFGGASLTHKDYFEPENHFQ